MKNRDLIKLLSELPEDADVYVSDPERKKMSIYQTIYTHTWYKDNDGQKEVEINTLG